MRELLCCTTEATDRRRLTRMPLSNTLPDALSRDTLSEPMGAAPEVGEEEVGEDDVGEPREGRD